MQDRPDDDGERENAEPCDCALCALARLMTKAERLAKPDEGDDLDDDEPGDVLAEIIDSAEDCDCPICRGIIDGDVTPDEPDDAEDDDDGDSMLRAIIDAFAGSAALTVRVDRIRASAINRRKMVRH